MSNNIDFWTLRDNAPIIKIQIAEIEIQIRIFFNVNCCENMFESHQKGNDYRTAFAKSIFYMYPVSYTHLDVYKRQDLLWTIHTDCR